MREPEVEARLREHLVTLGYTLVPRQRAHGHDVEATMDGRRLIVEVKGDRPGHISSPGTIYVDTCTLLGQIMLAYGSNKADAYGIAIRPVHLAMIRRALPALVTLGVRVWLVGDDVVDEVR